jgi:hypothetical protein
MSWRRLESSAVDPDLVEGLEARVADPYWALARQWRVGEFHGEDAASPVLISAEIATSPLTAYRASVSGGGSQVDREHGGVPLEALVEQERSGSATLARLNAQSGQVLVRSLVAAKAPIEFIARLRSRFPLHLAADDGSDPASRARLELLAKHVPDTAAIVRLVSGTADPVATLAVAVGATSPLGSSVAAAFRRWLAGQTHLVVATGTGAWRTESLSYQFEVAAPAAAGNVQLAADHYRGGRLDWSDFDRTEASALVPAGAATRRRVVTLATPLRYPGIPARRFWQFEDQTVGFGGIVGGAQDLVRSVVAAFGSIYGDDWLVVPHEVAAGSVARVVTLHVLDDYSEEHFIRSAAELDGPGRVFRFFELTGDKGPDAPELDDRVAPVVVVGVTCGDVVPGPPLETVRFVRDEAANIAWAIEDRVEGAGGRAVSRHDARSPVANPASTAETWRYELTSSVPPRWIPLVPVFTESGDVYLRRGRMAVLPPGIDPADALAKGRILEAGKPVAIWEEAIPAVGIEITRRFQTARSVNGDMHLWVGRDTRSHRIATRGRFETDTLTPPT